MIWKMTLLGFIGSKFCKKCECSLACFQFFFGQLSKIDTSEIRKKGLSERDVCLLNKGSKAKQGPALGVQFMV